MSEKLQNFAKRVKLFFLPTIALGETLQVEARLSKKTTTYHHKNPCSSSESDEKEEDADGGRDNTQEQDLEPFNDMEESKDTDPLRS